MINMNFIRENTELFRKLINLKNIDIDVNELIELDKACREMQFVVEQKRALLKKYSRDRNIDAAKTLKTELNLLEKELVTKTEKFKQIYSFVPNTLSADVPIGKDDTENVEIYRFGDISDKGFKPLSHEILGEKLGILNIQKATKISGRGFFYWINDGLRLKNAIFAYTESLLENRGFQLLGTPLFTKEYALFCTGYHPFLQDQEFVISGWDLMPIGTSEQTIVPFHSDEVLNGNDLPLLYTAQTPCFRSESGAAGKANRGIFRVHQFYKQEQIIFCKPEESERMQLFCQRNVEDIMKGLEIPFRVVNVCAGDIAAPGFKKFDTEAWFPSQEMYKETHSNSNLTDFQARRANIKFLENGKRDFVHTISSTAVTERVVIALMENNQTKDGYITIPKALQQFMDGQEVIKPQQRKPLNLSDDFTDIQNRIKRQTYKSFGDYEK